MKHFSQVSGPAIAQKLALVKITNDLLLASDKGCILVASLLALSAAFDTIDHDILIDRLQNYTGYSRASSKMV